MTDDTLNLWMWDRGGYRQFGITDRATARETCQGSPGRVVAVDHDGKVVFRSRNEQRQMLIERTARLNREARQAEIADKHGVIE